MGLIEKITSVENMELAMNRVKSNKGTAGIDKMTVDEMDQYFHEHGAKLRKQIQESINQNQSEEPISQKQMGREDR